MRSMYGRLTGVCYTQDLGRHYPFLYAVALTPIRRKRPERKQQLDEGLSAAGTTLMEIGAIMVAGSLKNR